MPQKSNPISCETVIGLTSISITIAQGMYGAMTPGYERATGEWQIEWDTLPIVCAGTAGSLSLIVEITRNLSVNKERMKENLELNQGLIMSESVMMLLAEEIGKQKAHELMYRLSKKSSTENKKLQKVLEEDETASKLVNFEKIRSALNPTGYLGEAPDLARKSVVNWDSLFPENGRSGSKGINY
ncbi:hypothetical protein [Lentibacillus amyloliquefaciens]|uniref:Adenylosuccinate lyase C-terminal domain-containing protein n=1 Tax=Lentibacillus amyloliquefaciens TaxID=1472767 RepID=A0A0U4G4K1_9BACI|nr:hypothetical protein [Lentibacillus amyloliquefaciens]ALX47578.1 hypothetical protein AOX59_02540 [Lentibacillus amyloliquefaciens]